MLVHTALAFQVHHQWSHAVAEADTGRQTQVLTGIDWGGGIWLNYLLVTVWIADALWNLAAPGSYTRRPRWIAYALHGFLVFMWFNATVVFGSWPMRIVGVAAFGWLAFRTFQGTGERTERAS
jgi:hypothetical protein